MSRELIESITAGNLLDANDILEAKLAQIRERKLHEMKRMYSAQLDEVLGAFAPGGDPDELRAKGYRPAADELDRREKEKADNLRKTFGLAPKDKRNGRFRRNWNTLMGRSPGYKPEDVPEKERGGRVGKIVRKAAINIGSSLADVGSGSLR